MSGSYYTKSNPKVLDYNPITHTTLYNTHQKTQSIDCSRDRRYRSVETRQSSPKNTFLMSGARQATPAFFKVERRYRNRSRNTSFNPISGLHQRYTNGPRENNDFFVPNQSSDKIGGVRRRCVNTNYINPISLKYSDTFKFEVSASKFFDN